MSDSQHAAWLAERRAALGFSAAVPGRGSGPPRGPSDALLNLSANRAAKWEECPHAYEKEYVQGRSRIAGPVPAPLRKGAAGHRALEVLARRRLLGEMPASEPVSKAELETELRNAASSYRLSTVEYRELLRAVGSARSRLDFSRTLAVEEPFELNLSEGVYAVGKFDRLDEVEQPATRWRAGGTWLQVVDYKTGDDVMTVDEATADLQVGLYLAALHEATGQRNITFRLWYLAHNRDVWVDWSRDLHDLTLRRLDRIAQEMRTATTFPGNVGAHCSTCPFRSECTYYASAIRGEATPLTDAARGDEELLKERRRCSNLAKLFDAQRKECDEVIRAQLVDRPLIVGAGLRAKLVTRTQYRDPPLDALVRTLSEQTGAEPEAIRAAVTGVDRRALKDYLEGLDGDVRKRVDEALDGLYEPYDASTYVDVRSI